MATVPGFILIDICNNTLLSIIIVMQLFLSFDSNISEQQSFISFKIPVPILLLLWQQCQGLFCCMREWHVINDDSDDVLYPYNIKSSSVLFPYEVATSIFLPLGSSAEVYFDE